MMIGAGQSLAGSKPRNQSKNKRSKVRLEAQKQSCEAGALARRLNKLFTVRNCLVPGAQKASGVVIMTGLFSPLATACGNIGLLSTIPFIINKHANHFVYHTYACAAQGLQQTLSSNQQSQRLKLNLEGSTMVTQNNCLLHYSFFFSLSLPPYIYSFIYFSSCLTFYDAKIQLIWVFPLFRLRPPHR